MRYVTVPRADHGRSVGNAIANGPAMLSIHVVVGLLLGLAAMGVLAQAVIVRRPGAIALSAAGPARSSVPASTGQLVQGRLDPPLGDGNGRAQHLREEADP